MCVQGSLYVYDNTKMHASVAQNNTVKNVNKYGLTVYINNDVSAWSTASPSGRDYSALLLAIVRHYQPAPVCINALPVQSDQVMRTEEIQYAVR